MPRDSEGEAWVEIEKRLREVIDEHAEWRSKCLLERLRPDEFTASTLDLVALENAAEILCKKVLSGRKGTALDLIVGVNQGGMAVAAMMNAVFAIPAGVIMTGVRDQVRRVHHVALPKIAKKSPSILVVDAKLKTGNSAVQVCSCLKKRYPSAELQFAIVLAYGGWMSRWELRNPSFPPLVHLKEEDIAAYVAYYTAAGPDDEPMIVEIYRPHGRLSGR